LSVASLLGLCAILFGKFWRDAGMPIPLAAACTIGVGALAGGLNATLIAWLRLPPLIVTLGTYSLFRGLAEAITHGVDTFTDFPSSFLFLGQERWLGIPAQAFVFIIATIFFWLLVHRTTFGRSFRAIGFSPEGAHYAGIPVGRRVAMVYVLAGGRLGHRGHHLHRAARTGEGRRRHGLRVVCHHRRRAGRHEHFWRRRSDSRHPARRGGDCGSAQWYRPRAAAGRNGRDAHGRPPDSSAGRFNPPKNDFGLAHAQIHAQIWRNKFHEKNIFDPAHPDCRSLFRLQTKFRKTPSGGNNTSTPVAKSIDHWVPA